MSRLPSITRADCDDAQGALWDSLVESRGTGLSLVDDDGHLIGPFAAMVARPRAGRSISELGGTLRFRNALDRRLLEIAICTVGAHWKSEFEFWAHRAMAVEAGVDEDALDALAAGDTPAFDDEEARLVHAWAHALVTTGHPDPALHDQLSAAIGTDALIDLTMTCGYYCLISFVLNGFGVELPPGATPTWAHR